MSETVWMYELTTTSDGWYNDPLNASWNASGVYPAFFGSFPEIAFDSFLTTGADNASSAQQAQLTLNSSVDIQLQFAGAYGDGASVSTRPAYLTWYNVIHSRPRGLCGESREVLVE